MYSGRKDESSTLLLHLTTRFKSSQLLVAGINYRKYEACRPEVICNDDEGSMIMMRIIILRSTEHSLLRTGFALSGIIIWNHPSRVSSSSSAMPGNKGRVLVKYIRRESIGYSCCTRPVLVFVVNKIHVCKLCMINCKSPLCVSSWASLSLPALCCVL